MNPPDFKLTPADPLYHLPSDTNSLLDVGCNVGALLLSASRLGVTELKGIEINKNAVEIAQQNIEGVAHCDVLHASADSIPFSNQCVDVVTCCEVLEHIPADKRERTLAEIARVLKPRGLLIFSVPFDGIFSFLDPANWRLRFPTAFRILSRLVGGKGREAGYVGGEEEVIWHHHFSQKEIEILFDRYFEIEKIRWRGAVLSPVINWLQFPFYRRKAFQNPLLKILNALAAWDSKIDYGSRLSYDVLIVARKREPSVSD